MGKKLRNAIGTLFLVLAIAATQIPVSDVEAVTSSASDFQVNGGTLVKYTGTATAVNVPESVKKIGPEAFKDDSDLYAVYLPEGITSIGSGAFSNCPVLSVMDLPDSLKKIDNFAFSNCKALSDVTIGPGVTEIGYGVFAGCESLKDVQVDQDNQYFLDEAGILYNQSKSRLIQALAGSRFTKYNMPASVEKIEPYAFWGCDDLRFVELSGSLDSIPGYAFSNCSGLEEISIPSSVRTIGSKAFSDCINLEKAVIPAAVTSIQSTAFDGCPKLSIVAEAGSYAEEFDQARDKSDVSRAEYQDTGNPSNEGAETQNPVVYGQEEQNALQEMGSTYVVGGRAVVFMDNRTQNVYGNAAVPQKSGDAFPQSNEVAMTVSGQTAEDGQHSVSDNGTDGATDAEKGGSFPKYTIVGDRIAGQAYYQDPELTEYQFPEGITEIGDFAFARSALSEVRIPEGVTTIGYGAFYHCDDLKSVTIPSTVKEIEPNAFEKTAWLENWKNGGSVNDFQIVGDGILIAYKGSDSKISIPEGVKQITAGVFRNHKGITDVSLPNTLEQIGEEAFLGCSNLKSVSGGVNVKEIRDRAFAGCPIETVRIPESVEKIGLGAYDQSACSNVSDVNAVVFMGSSLPVLSYGKDAQRLSNGKNRIDAFKGIEVAVVGAGMSEFSGTVLDPDSYGFHGTIASLVQKSSGGAEGVLQAVMVTKEKDEDSSAIPERVSIYQKPYRFENDSEAAVESAARQGDAADAGKAVQIWTNGAGLDGKVSAVLDHHKERYVLDIRESSQAAEQILSAYRILYGQEANPGMYGYDITLYDQSGQIPITKLGRETMKITMPVPEGMGTESLHVVCTDEDGQLEEVPAVVQEENGGFTVTFEATHFSPYGIYQYENGQGAVIQRKDGGVLTALSRKKDVSPDTGDWIHPKWFLATGLFALSMMMFFLKGNRKKTPGIM